MIGRAQLVDKALEQRLRTRIRVRLERADHTPVMHQPDSLQKRVELVGMVGIVVVDVCAVEAALVFEPAARAVELCERRGCGFAGNAEFPCHRAGGQRVQRVVTANDAQMQVRIRLPAAENVKFAEIFREVLPVHVVFRIEAE